MPINGKIRTVGSKLGGFCSYSDEYVFYRRDTKVVPLNYRLEQIEMFDEGFRIEAVRQTMSDGSQLPRGDETKSFNAVYKLPVNTKIAKVRACFGMVANPR